MEENEMDRYFRLEFKQSQKQTQLPKKSKDKQTKYSFTKNQELNEMSISNISTKGSKCKQSKEQIESFEVIENIQHNEDSKNQQNIFNCIQIIKNWLIQPNKKQDISNKNQLELKIFQNSNKQKERQREKLIELDRFEQVQYLNKKPHFAIKVVLISSLTQDYLSQDDLKDLFKYYKKDRFQINKTLFTNCKQMLHQNFLLLLQNYLLSKVLQFDGFILQFIDQGEQKTGCLMMTFIDKQEIMITQQSIFNIINKMVRQKNQLKILLIFQWCFSEKLIQELDFMFNDNKYKHLKNNIDILVGPNLKIYVHTFTKALQLLMNNQKQSARKLIQTSKKQYWNFYLHKLLCEHCIKQIKHNKKYNIFQLLQQKNKFTIVNRFMIDYFFNITSLQDVRQKGFNITQYKNTRAVQLKYVGGDIYRGQVIGQQQYRHNFGVYYSNKKQKHIDTRQRQLPTGQILQISCKVHD